MQKLIMITGEAWTGKSSSAELAFRMFDNSAWLDGDDVWKVNPFSIEDKRLRNSDKSMAFVVDNYLHSKFDYVFFSSIVLVDKQIRERILRLITYKDYQLIFITLHADTNTLTKRAKIRDNNRSPIFRLLEESLKNKSIFINTALNTPLETANEIAMVIKDSS